MTIVPFSSFIRFYYNSESDIYFEVFIFQATDKDELKNGEVTFFIEDSESVPFEVGAVSGDLLTTGLLNYTQYTSYSFNVKAENKDANHREEMTSETDVKVRKMFFFYLVV